MSDLPPISNLDSGDATAAPLQPRTRTLPESIGPYRVLDEIGAGGMGLVYRARRADLQQDVAIKLIKLGMDTDEVLARFESERQALALLNHPNVARVFDAGATDTGRPYFVMEYVPGVPITEFCDTSNLSTRERLELFVQACNAVQHAHQKGIIHRDLKPSNMLVSIQQGRPVVKVIDFGLAKATTHSLAKDHTLFTQRGQILGTPEYMSPEQAEMSSLDIDTRSDIYSLGVILYELLIGSRPFDSKALRDSGFDEMRRIIREVDPPRASARLTTLGPDEAEKVARQRRLPLHTLRLELKRELEWIPLKAMRKQRADRYQTVAEMAEDVGNYLENRPLIAGPEAQWYRFRKWVRRQRVPIAVGVTIFVLLIAGVTVSTIQTIRAERNRARAERRLDDIQKLMTRFDELNQNLRPIPGTIDARKRLASFSADFLDALYHDGPAGIDDRLLEKVGRAYLNLGDMQGGIHVSGNIGDFDGAAASYRKSIDLLERARQKDPTPTITRALAVALERSGEQALRVNAFDEALRQFTRSDELTTTLVQQQPDDLGILHNKAVIVQKLAGAKAGLRRFDDAVADMQRSVGAFRELLKREPDSAPRRVNLTAALYNLAQIHEQRNEPEPASAAYSEAFVFADEADRMMQTKDFESQRLLAISAAMAGVYDAKAGRLEQGLVRMDRSFDVLRTAMERDPQNYDAKFAARKCIGYLAREWESLATHSRNLADDQRTNLWQRCDQAYELLPKVVEEIHRMRPLPDKDKQLAELSQARERCRAALRGNSQPTTHTDHP